MNKQHLFILTGASRGMGLAMAQQLLAPQHSLLCISRSAVRSLAEAAHAVRCPLQQWEQDLSRPPQSAQRLADWLTTQGPDGYASATLINNAGVIPRVTHLAHAGLGDVSHALRVGLEAPMLLCAAFLGATEHWGIPRKVLNISSGLGRRPMASQSPYCAAKAGMDHFSRCLALEEAARPGGAQVCSLAPGVIDTDMQTWLRQASPDEFPDVGHFERLKASGQLTSAEEAARHVLAWLQRPDFGNPPIADVRDA